jgi:hypothetical protein
VLKHSLQGVIFLLLGLVLSYASHAMVVEDLYSAEVVVPDKGPQALAIGAREALSQVLVKNSGSTDVLQNPVLASALELQRSRSLVQQYAYISRNADSGQFLARFEFDEAVISNLIASSGAPLWTENRPAVLVWMVVEGPDGKQFLNNDTLPAMVSLITAEFARRGVPARFPLYDLTDAALVTADEVWRLDSFSLVAASQRYGVQGILAGRLAILSNGSGTGDWSYLSGSSRTDRSIRVGDSEAFFQAGVSLVAEEMSSRYAVAPTTATSEGIKVQVTGVSNYSDYAGIVSWLEGLELIDSANVESIRGDTLRFNLVAQADAQQLATIIELNKKLLPAPSPDASVQLSYQWKR